MDHRPGPAYAPATALERINVENPGPPLNRLRALWAGDRCALGAIATIPSVQTIQILAASGLDFIIIDMEHGPIGPAEAHVMIAATSGTPMVPLVRVAATTGLAREGAARPRRHGRVLPADRDTGRRRGGRGMSRSMLKLVRLASPGCGLS
jgi:hypothetical protein